MKQPYESLIYSYEEWNKVGHKKMPYCFQIEGKNQYLFYFGANHSRDPKDKQYKELKQYWQEFLKKTGGHNCTVLVEGGKRKIAENEDTAIRSDSEAGFITLLASQAAIPTDSPEPGGRYEREELTKKFSKEEVQYYYFARVVHQWNSFPNPKPDFEDYLKRFLRMDERDSNWSDFDFSLENMKAIHKKLFNNDFNENDNEFFYSIINPTKENTVINKVARVCSTLRNVYIVQKIEELWLAGRNLFVVFGAAHAIMQESALRKLLK